MERNFDAKLTPIQSFGHSFTINRHILYRDWDYNGEIAHGIEILRRECYEGMDKYVDSQDETINAHILFSPVKIHVDTPTDEFKPITIYAHAVAYGVVKQEVK